MTTNIRQLQIHRWARAGYVAPLKTRTPLFPGLRRELVALAVDYGRTVDDGHCGGCGMREGHVSGCVLAPQPVAKPAEAKEHGEPVREFVRPGWKRGSVGNNWVHEDSRMVVYRVQSRGRYRWLYDPDYDRYHATLEAAQLLVEREHAAAKANQPARSSEGSPRPEWYFEIAAELINGHVIWLHPRIDGAWGVIWSDGLMWRTPTNAWGSLENAMLQCEKQLAGITPEAAKSAGLSSSWKATDDDESFVRVDGRGKIFNTGSSRRPDWCCVVAGRCCCDLFSGKKITEPKVAAAYVDAHLATLDAGAQS